MNIGSGTDRPMSKVNRTLLHTAVLIVLGSSLVLAGCGQISLNQLLENEDPGEFRLSPEVANVPDGSTVALEGHGGFKPYTYTLLTGKGDLDPQTGVYIASGGIETAEIEGTDNFGTTDTSQIKVFAPLKLKLNGLLIPKITIYDYQTVAFDADGGVVAAGYEYFVNNLLTYTSGSNGQWTFAPAAAGFYLIVVEDDLENSAVATVEVVHYGGGDLAITPTETDAPQGGTVPFEGLNVVGTAVYTASPAVGSFAPSGDDAVYTTPAAPFTGTVTITLTDDYASVSATVEVLQIDPGDLAITPTETDVFQDGTVSFKGLNVVGTAVYTASPAVGSFAPSGDDALYTAPSAPFRGTVTVTLTDASESVTAVVHVTAIDPGDLAITPTETHVLQGETVTFTGLNVFGTAVYTASPAVGSFVPSGDDALYTAPAAPFTGTVEVTLTDDTESVSAKVLVSDSDPGPLVISPSSLENLGYGDQVVFTVSGGVLPYSFWLEYDGGGGKLEQIGATQARYSAPQFNTTDKVWVEDALGASQQVKVKVKAK